MILPQIIEVLLLYENAVFKSKIILSERIFSERNDSLSKDWLDVRDKYLIPKLQYQFVHFLSFLPKYQNLT